MKSTPSHKKNRYSKQTNQGFTLIELLVVIAIIAILSSVVLASLTVARQKAEDTRIASDIEQIKNSLEIYAVDHNGNYPPTAFIERPSTIGDALKEGKEPSYVSNAVTTALSLVTSKADASGHIDALCVNYDNLASILVPKYLGSMPIYPFDDGASNCYKYKSNGTTAVVFGSYVDQKYGAGFNKQVGAAVGKTDVATLAAICTTAGFPVFDPNSTGGAACVGSDIADQVVGITIGQSTTTSGGGGDGGGGSEEGSDGSGSDSGGDEGGGGDIGS